MIRKKIIILSIFLQFILQSSMMAQDVVGVKFEEKPLKELLAIARTQHKMLFVDCYTTWCGPCRKMANEVFPQKILGDYMNSIFVSAKIDMEKGEGVELKNKWDINSFPTFVVLDVDGNVKFRVVGYNEAQAMMNTLKTNLQHNGPSVLEQSYQAGNRTPELITDYVSELQKSNMRNKIEAVVEEFCNSHPEILLSNEKAFRIFRDYIVNPYDTSFIYVYKHRADFIVKYGENTGQMLEDKWRMYAKNFYIMKPKTNEFKGYDRVKMDEYESFMKQNGVTKAAVYTMIYKLPASFSMNDKELLFKNLEQSVPMNDISQSQFDFGCSILEKIIVNETDIKRLENIKNLRKQTI